MNTPSSIQALRRANPRAKAGFADSVAATVEDLIAEEDMVITISHTGYIKRIPVSTYKRQRRGGRGLNGADLAATAGATRPGTGRSGHATPLAGGPLTPRRLVRASTVGTLMAAAAAVAAARVLLLIRRTLGVHAAIAFT